ncbi:MRNIP isoform 8 [Pongo abelii]|uniref:MRNIP isoform 3 n=1 Tax=Pongo abelii TaxID=9601 RepID=A0A2J8SCV3_PONAB|nr:MRNIP isoform 3 [Pongo abelii]PNJ18572.1 MRNIP isoform 8 [Pongo abelii]
MAPPQRSRVLRCCSCRLFQAHQVKKSVKWTCKACGEKQSFLRSSPDTELLLPSFLFLQEVKWIEQCLQRLMVKALVLTVDAMSKN